MLHPLKIYLRSISLSLKDFAVVADTSVMSLYRLMNGSGELTTGLIRQVSEATHSNVPAEVLLKHFESEKRKSNTGSSKTFSDPVLSDSSK